MPSGAKKRKAAKKKRRNEGQGLKNNNNNNDNHHADGNDDPRSHEERESDEGVSSSASPDHENQPNPFTEGNEESGKTNVFPDQSFVNDSESAKEVTGNTEDTKNVVLDNEVTIEIQTKLKYEENIEIIDFGVEHDKSSSSNSSNSADESQETQKKSEKETNNSAIEAVTYNDVDNNAESLVEKAMQVTENVPLSYITVNTILEAVPAVDSAEPIGIPDENSAVTNDIKSVSNEKENKSVPKLGDEIVGTSSGVTNCDVKEIEDRILPLSDPVPKSTNVADSVKESEIPESCEKEPLAHPVVKRTSWLSCCGLFDVIT